MVMAAMAADVGRPPRAREWRCAARAAEQVDRAIGRGERERRVGLARPVVDSTSVKLPSHSSSLSSTVRHWGVTRRGGKREVRCSGMAASMIENESQLRPCPSGSTIISASDGATHSRPRSCVPAPGQRSKIAPPLRLCCSRPWRTPAGVRDGNDESVLAGSQGGGLAFMPADGSVVSVGSSFTSFSWTEDDGTASAPAQRSATSPSSGGEITVGSLRAAVNASGEWADVSDSGMTNLFVLGSSIAPSANLEPRSATGAATASCGRARTRSSGLVSAWQGSVTGLVIHLDADTRLPAGIDDVIGHAEGPGTHRSPRERRPRPMGRRPTPAHDDLLAPRARAEGRRRPPSRLLQTTSQPSAEAPLPAPGTPLSGDKTTRETGYRCKPRSRM